MMMTIIKNLLLNTFFRKTTVELVAITFLQEARRECPRPAGFLPQERNAEVEKLHPKIVKLRMTSVIDLLFVELNGT